MLLRTFLACACLVSGSSAVAQPTLVTNIHVVDVELGKVSDDLSLVVENGIILRIVDREVTLDPQQFNVIDGKGAYVLPGLIDAHTHHFDIVPYEAYLRYGVTTVIGLGNRTGSENFVEFRALVEKGERLGPRIYTADKLMPWSDGSPIAEEAKEYVRSLRQNGFDLVKISERIAPETFDLVVAEARKAHLPVFGHIPRDIPLERSMEGLDVVAHAEEFYFALGQGPVDDDLQRFDGALPDFDTIPTAIALMKANDVALIPNLSYGFATLRFWDDEAAALSVPEARFWPEIALGAWQQMNSARRDQVEKRMLRERIKNFYSHELTRQASAAGILIVTGTDAPDRQMIPGISIHSEIRELVKAGLDNREAIAAATLAGGELIAKYVDPTARLGRIAPGYEADLVLLTENPLEDVRNLRAISAIMTDGTLYSREELDQLQLAAKARIDAEYADQ